MGAGATRRPRLSLSPVHSLSTSRARPRSWVALNDGVANAIAKSIAMDFAAHLRRATPAASPARAHRARNR
eukprot:3445663-Pyramimonas_sp.AAC.1